jgi:hypothetical protein
MKIPGRSPKPAPQPTPQPAARTARKGPGPRVRRLEDEVKTLRRKVALLEQEVQETRQLNKRLAEITDVVAEVLLPAEQRDDERLRAVLQRYESSL